MTEPKNELTLWARVVYNTDDLWVISEAPTSFEDVARLNFMELINQMDWMRNDSESPDQKRLCSIAITKLEEACMFFIKASTFGK
jgi:hypothetical protein